MTKFWNLQNDAEIPEDGVLDIDGEIVAEKGWFTSDDACIAKDFRKALKGVKNVTVHINSPGGDVIAGAEIYSALREHSMNGEGSVTVIITGIAASAASIIAMAGDRILMHPVAYMMIHNPWTIAVGDAKELRKAAKTLDVIGEGLITTYQQRTGKDRDELKKMLENETWMSAVTCIEEGFADEIYGASAGAAASASRPTLMSMKSHGLQEIAARIRDEDPDEKDPDEEEEDPKKPEEEDPEKEPEGEDPDEKDPEKEDPEEDPEKEDPEEDPEKEDPEEDPEKEEEARKRAMIARRASIAAAAWAGAEKRIQ